MIGGIFGGIYASAGKKALLKAETRGRTDEQAAVISYFNAEGGCMSGFFGFKDKDFDGHLSSVVGGLNIKAMALNKLCLDESQVGEITPIMLDNYYYDKPRWLEQAVLPGSKGGSVMSTGSDAVGTYVKIGKDDVYRFSKYMMSCIFCSAEQIYYYSYRFDLTNLSTTEEAAELFYKDIDSVQVMTRVNETVKPNKGCLGFLQPPVYETYTVPTLTLTVGGASFSCSMRPEHENQIHGLKNLIRDKKSQLG